MGIKSPEQKEDYVKIVDHGFRPDEIVEGDHYVLGAYTKLPKVVHMQQGHGWRKFLPPFERQSHTRLETMNCTNYGTLNIWEALALLLFKIQFDWSERYTGVGTGTTKQGNSPHTVAETIRTEIGLIAETLLPFNDGIETWDDYYSPKPMDAKLLALGKAFLDEYELGHEWVFKGGTVREKQVALMEALQYSPVGVSVIAWQKRGGKYWKEVGQGDNHWCVVFDYEEGEKWDVFDTYDGGFKELEWDYDFGFAKRYAITKKNAEESETSEDFSDTTPVKKKTFWQRLLEWLFGENRDYVVEK